MATQSKYGAWLAALAVFTLLNGQPLASDDTTKDFRSAKAAVVKQLRDRNPETRVAAARKLADYPVVDAAKVLMLQGMESDFEDVRRASLATLATFHDEQAICDYLHGESLKGLKRNPIALKTAAALAVLFSSSLPEVPRQAEPLLNQLAESPDGPLLLVTLVDELGRQGDELSLHVLLKLRELPLFQKFGPRRALAQALINIRKPKAVSELIKILQRVQGEVYVEIAQHLTNLSGQRLENADAWSDWWKKAEPTFEFPPAAQADPLTALVPRAVPTYYGLPLYGSKIVFIIDASVSMRGPRIEAAKRELIKAINDLPSNAEFNVLAFSLGVKPWQSQLVPSTKEKKLEATRFVQSLPLASRTASFDALEAALGFDTEVVYFLTDGAPNDGKVVQPAEIVSIISKVNRVRRVTINAIGVGVGPDFGPFAVFLKTLAGQNFGTFRRVDE